MRYPVLTMLIYQILEDENIVVIELKGPLSELDFRELTRDVDLHLVRTETLKGVLVHAPEFPGWDTISAMFTHLRFIRDHHRLVEKVALASDSSMATIMPKLVDHFVGTEVKGFTFDGRDEAMAWLKSSD